MMADYLIMKAVEYDKLPVKFKKAHPFDGLMAEGYWLQKKYDGCMGIAIIGHPCSDHKSRMLSRTGEDYTASTGHILAELEEALGDSQRLDEQLIFIGEVWQPVNEAKFPAISGKFRRQKPSPELRFVVNDVLPLGFNTDTPYRERFQELRDLLGDNDPAWKVMVAETFKDWPGSPVRAALVWQSEGGFDGGILRNPLAGYTVGTVKNGEIIKLKPTLSLDLMCEEIKVETGEKTGRDVYTIRVTYQGVDTWVGSGLGHEHPECFAKIVEIECLGLTEDGKLREPRFKGVRIDKLKAD